KANRARAHAQTKHARRVVDAHGTQRRHAAARLVLYTDCDAAGRLQLHGQCVLGQLGAVRQRIADRRSPKPVSVDSATRERLVPRTQSRLVSDVGRPPIRAELRSRISETSIYISILIEP